MMQHDRLEAGLIRKLWPADAERYGDHLLRLDANSRRNRFGNTANDANLRAHARDALRYPGIAHGFFVDGVLRGASELFVLPRDATLVAEAEAALSVEQDWQSHGVGSALLERTILAARNRGVAHLHMSCFAHNERMQQLARKFDAALTFDFGSITGHVEAPYPTPMSMWREMVVDGHAVATAMLDRQARMLRQG